MSKLFSPLLLSIALSQLLLVQPVLAEKEGFLTSKVSINTGVEKTDHDQQYQFLLKKMFNIKDLEQKVYAGKSKKEAALKHLKDYQGQGVYSDKTLRKIPVDAVSSQRAAKDSYQTVLKQIKQGLADRGYVNYSKKPKSVKSITDYKRVTNSFFETNLRDALNEVSQQVNIPFLMDESIQGTVTVKLDNAPLNRALEMLLVGGGFEYIEDQEYILIGFPQSSSPIFKRLSKTQVVHPVYAKPTEIEELLSNDYKSFVKFNDVTNSIVITAPADFSNRIMADIAIIDHRPAQMKLEVLIADVTMSAKRKMGRDLWNDSVRGVGSVGGLPFDLASNGEDGFTLSIVPSGEDLLSTLGASTSNPIGLAGVSTLKYFTGVFTAMEDTGEARVWATPSVVASDGKVAIIDVSTEQIVPIKSGSGDMASFTTKKFTSGVGMRILPRISLNGEINLDIKEIQVSTVAFTGQRQQDQRLPVKTQRKISTFVALKNRETLIIGGLLDVQHGDDAKYFPGMKSANPLLGTNQQTRETRDLVIFITPTLLQEHASVKKVESFL
jgi:type II secretory pathway component GspD/PulD (secretin)